MRHVLASLVIGLSALLSGCMSDNYDYVSAFQPNYYNDSGLRLGYATGPHAHHLRDLRMPEARR